MIKPSVEELKNTATQIRRDVLRMVHACKSGHPGGSLGCADFFTAMYFSIMNHNPEFSMDGINEDIFILSNGHISPVFYSTLARSGYFPLAELNTFRRINSRLQGHPATHEKLPGVRVATGSLGQGISVAVGAALAKKLNNDKNFVFALMGDGEIQEGQCWEAFMFAAAHKVDNLIVTLDFNGKQIDGNTNEIMGINESVADKLVSFGWQVLHMDGHNIQNIIDTITHAKNISGNGKPVFIVMRTEMGYPIDFMMGTHKWHGVAPNDTELEKALSQLSETIGDY
ncbi:MAG: transketolase [Bacteroidia bacterium]